jgi:hypothetical protein
MRRLGHRFGAADEAHLRVTKNDFLGATDDGLESGPAQSIQGERRRFLAAARFQRNVTREIDRVVGGVEDVAEVRLIDIVCGDSRAIDRELLRNDGEIDGGEILELPAEGAERGADRGEEDDVGWGGGHCFNIPRGDDGTG